MGSSFGQNQQSSLDDNVRAIDRFFAMETSQLPFSQVIPLAAEIVSNRESYNSDTLARTYALISEIASVKGESARANQLALYGLTYKGTTADVVLNLKLKRASWHFFNNEFNELIDYIEPVIAQAETGEFQQYRMQALAYRAMGNAMLGNHQASLEDLLLIEQVINTNPKFPNIIELYELLGISQYFLGNHGLALNMYSRAIDRRFNDDKLIGISQTYSRLGDGYAVLGQFDDAYNAYWEAKKFANAHQFPIRIAYAELGIGQVMLSQKEYEKAFTSLIEAENLFKGKNLRKPYINTLSALIISSQQTGRVELAGQLLKQASEMIELLTFLPEQAELYILLSKYYQSNGEYEKAVSLLEQYVSENKVQSHSIARSAGVNEEVEQGRKQAMKVVEVSESRLAEKPNNNQYMQVLLLLLCFVLALLVLILWYQLRAQRLNFAYEQNERPSYLLLKPTETKQLYHRKYKQARKYEYPISIGYIEIKNWQDIAFQFNKRTVSEVAKTIATIINEHLGEFDYAGQINEGEYLLMYPHQEKVESQEKMDKLVDALKVRFFANLGQFSVNIGYSIEEPCIQDIDPYIFLSRLSET